MDKFWERYIQSRPAPGSSKGAFDAFAAAHRDPGPRNMYAGGQLVSPSVDGSRPGYNGERKWQSAEKKYTGVAKPPKKKKWKGIFGKDAADEIFNDYKKFYTDAFNNKNMSQVSEATTYFKQVYGKDGEKAIDLLRRNGYANLKSAPYELKQKLLVELVDQAQNNIKYTNKFDILDKVFTEPTAKRVRADGISSLFKKGEKRQVLSWFTKDLFKKVDGMDKMDDKISKAIDYMVQNNVEIKDVKKATGSVFTQGASPGTKIRLSPIKKTIISLVDNGKDGISRANLQNGIAKNEWYKSQNFVSKGKIKNVFDYVAREYGNDFIGQGFNDAYEFSKNRFGRVKVAGSSQMRLPESLIWQFGVRSADRNFKLGNYDNSPVKITDLKGKPIDYGSLPVDERGLRIIDPKKHKFIYNGTLYGKKDLVKLGSKTGDFNKVYEIASEWQKYLDTDIPDPKNPNNTIKFSKLLEDSKIDKFMAIGHDDALGGVKDKPYSNFKIQNKFVNKSLDSAYRQVKNKDLRKRIANQIYGDLKGKTGDVYREAWIKQNTKLLNDINSGRLNIDTMDTPYRKAGKEVIGKAGSDFPEWGIKKSTEALRIAGIDPTKSEGKLALKKLLGNKTFVKWIKKFPCMKSDGGTPDIACHLKGMQHEKNLLAEGKGSRAMAKKFIDGTKMARKGGALKAIFGLGGLIGDVILEGGYAAYNYTQGKDAADIWRHSWYSFMDPSMWKDGKYVGWVEDAEKRKQYEIKDEEGNVTGIRKNVKRYYDNVDKLEKQLDLYDNLFSASQQDPTTQVGWEKKREKAMFKARTELSNFNTRINLEGGMDKIYKELEYDSPYVETRLEATGAQAEKDKVAVFEKMKEAGAFGEDEEYADRFDKPTQYKKRYQDFLDFRTTVFDRPTEPSFYLPKGKLHQRVEDPRYGVPYATRGGPTAQSDISGEGIENYLMFEAAQAGEPITRDEATKLKWKLIYEGGGLDLQDKIGIAGGVANMAGGGIVGIRRPSALPPTGGPMHQGLRSLYINDKDY